MVELRYMTPVVFEADNCKFGDIVNVKITSCSQKSLFGIYKTNKVKSSIISVKTNKQNKDSKEILITYGDDNSINIDIFNNEILNGK